MKRPRAQLAVGDIIELRTQRGLAYGQITHRHSAYGWLLRVFNGFYESPPSLHDILRSPALFSVFVAIEVGIRERVMRVCGNEAVPADAQEFPTFKWGLPGGASQKRDWWEWDGKSFERKHLGVELTSQQRDMPIEELVTPDVLIGRLEIGWRPSEPDLRDVFDRPTSQDATPALKPSVSHFLRFRGRRDAEAAASVLRARGLVAEVIENDDGEGIVVASDSSELGLAQAAQMESIAAAHDGTYEGNEIPLRFGSRHVN